MRGEGTETGKGGPGWGDRTACQCAQTHRQVTSRVDWLITGFFGAEEGALGGGGHKVQQGSLK